ncbi:MAG TPA: hypothetical protein VGP81_14330 [Pyrinomonadaceae bacterium]|nr:hypothetical protein [Pyrinomonadaceae bacterium]
MIRQANSPWISSELHGGFPRLNRPAARLTDREQAKTMKASRLRKS